MIIKEEFTKPYSPGGHSAHRHTRGQSEKISGNPKYLFSFIATQKYQLILYFDTWNRSFMSIKAMQILHLGCGIHWSKNTPKIIVSNWCYQLLKAYRCKIKDLWGFLVICHQQSSLYKIWSNMTQRQQTIASSLFLIGGSHLHYIMWGYTPTQHWPSLQVFSPSK